MNQSFSVGLYHALVLINNISIICCYMITFNLCFRHEIKKDYDAEAYFGSRFSCFLDACAPLAIYKFMASTPTFVSVAKFSLDCLSVGDSTVTTVADC